jgi:uncharacterized protein YxeA
MKYRTFELENSKDSVTFKSQKWNVKVTTKGKHLHVKIKGKELYERSIPNFKRQGLTSITYKARRNGKLEQYLKTKHTNQFISKFNTDVLEIDIETKGILINRQ